MGKYLKKGNVVQVSGQYKPVGQKNEYTFVQGKKVPPTNNGVTKFVLVDKTNHKK